METGIRICIPFLLQDHHSKNFLSAIFRFSDYFPASEILEFLWSMESGHGLHEKNAQVQDKPEAEINEIENSKVGILRAFVETEDPSSKVYVVITCRS